MPAAKPPEFRRRAVELARERAKPIRSRDELAGAIFEWIECFYNPRRRHSALGMLSPIAFEADHTAAEEAA